MSGQISLSHTGHTTSGFHQNSSKCQGEHRWGGVTSDLELGADAGRLLLLVEVEEGLGNAVVERQVAEVFEGLDIQQVLWER